MPVQFGALNRDYSEDFRTGMNIGAFPALLQDGLELLMATSGSGIPNDGERPAPDQ